VQKNEKTRSRAKAGHPKKESPLLLRFNEKQHSKLLIAADRKGITAAEFVRNYLAKVIGN